MPFTQADLTAIHTLLAPVIGREAWGVHLGYGARLTICFGEDRSETRTLRSGRQWSLTRGEWDVWTVFSVWRLEDAAGVLTAYEDPRPLMDPALAQLNGRRLLSVDIAPLSADTTFTFDGGLVLRLFSVYMDPEGDQEHWMLFAPHGRVLVIGPAAGWTDSHRSEVSSTVHKQDPAIRRFEALCNDAWPCAIDTFTLQHAHVGEKDRLDLEMQVHPSNSLDHRRMTLSFRDIRYLDFSQAGVETGIEYLRIEAVEERAWEGIAYAVHDPGQHILTFYCASFDVSLEHQ